MTSGARIALVGDEPELAESLVGVLLERGFDLDGVRVLAGEDREGEVLEVGDVRLRIDRVDAAALRAADAAVFFGSDRSHEAWMGRLPDGVLVIDAMPGASRRHGSEPVVPEVNAERIGALAARGALAMAAPATVGLAVALAPLHAAARVRRVVVTVLYPASSSGEIERLSRQAVTLMQGRSLDPETDPEHLAFNLRPQARAARAAWSADEALLASELVDLLGDPALEVVATGIRAPVFYGIGESVYVETEEALDADEAERLLLRGRGLIVPGPASTGAPEDAEPGETPIDVLLDWSPGPIEVVGSDAVHVARVRVDPRRPGALALWLCFDDLRKGFALNAIAALEVALRDVRV